MAYVNTHSSKGTVKLVRKGQKPEFKFPIKSASQAGNAMSRMNQAKPALAISNKKHIARIAKQKIGHTTPAIKRILGL